MPSWLPDSLHLSIKEAHCVTSEGENIHLYVFSEVTENDSWEIKAVTENGQWYIARNVADKRETVDGKSVTLSEQFAQVWSQSLLVITQEKASVLKIWYSRHHQQDISLHLVSEQSLHPVYILSCC